MYETLLRPHDVSAIPLPLPIGDIVEKLKQAEAKREDKRLRQIAANKRTAIKRKRDEGDDAEKFTDDPSGSKRVKTDEDDANVILSTETSTRLDDMDTTGASMPGLVPSKMSVSKALSEVRGHSSYLTFACLIPIISSETTPQQDEEAL